MGNMNLVTGYRGAEHVTADDHGSLYAGIFGEGSFVLARGSRFAATAISGNQINIADGDLVMQGRHGRIAPGSTVSVTIENGAQGYKRHDLIVARFTRNASTSVEDLSLTVVKGTATTGTAADPAYTDGDILNEKAETADFPLYRVVLNGVNIEAIDTLFAVVAFAMLDENGKLADGYFPDMGYIPISQKGAANGVAPLDSNGDVPIANLPYSNNPATSSLTMVPTCAALNQVYTMAKQGVNAEKDTFTISKNDTTYSINSSSGTYGQNGSLVLFHLTANITIPEKIAVDTGITAFLVGIEPPLEGQVAGFPFGDFDAGVCGVAYFSRRTSNSVYVRIKFDREIAGNLKIGFSGCYLTDA